MATMNKNDIGREAARLGLGLQVNAPGDGKRRYEFYLEFPPDHEDRGYHERRRLMGRTVGYCVGAREAELFLRGYDEGQRSREGVLRDILAYSTGETDDPATLHAKLADCADAVRRAARPAQS